MDSMKLGLCCGQLIIAEPSAELDIIIMTKDQFFRLSRILHVRLLGSKIALTYTRPSKPERSSVFGIPYNVYGQQRAYVRGATSPNCCLIIVRKNGGLNEI